MIFTLKSDLPISDLSSDEMTEWARFNIKHLTDKLTPEDESRQSFLRQKHYEFDKYEFDNFDFMFFFEKSKKGVGHLGTIVFYGKVEPDDFTREDYNTWNKKTWFNDTAFEKWHKAMEPIVRQAWDFMKIKDKYIYDPNRGNIKARNTTWSKTLSALPTLDPNFAL
jgi:hypothetical protein